MSDFTFSVSFQSHVNCCLCVFFNQLFQYLTCLKMLDFQSGIVENQCCLEKKKKGQTSTVQLCNFYIVFTFAPICLQIHVQHLDSVNTTFSYERCRCHFFVQLFIHLCSDCVYTTGKRGRVCSSILVLWQAFGKLCTFPRGIGAKSVLTCADREKASSFISH